MRSSKPPAAGRAGAPRLLSAVLVCAALVACGEDSPDKLIASARSFLAQQNPKAAVIELKNALQKVPDSGDARFLLGKALLDNGEAANAVVELRKARERKQPDDLVLPLLARAMNQTGQARQLVDEFGNATLTDANAQADLKSSVAMARAALGDIDAARRDLALALQAAPDNPAARLLEAKEMAARGDVPAALQATDTLLKKSPADVDGWVLKGDLLRVGKPDVEASLAAYRQALTLRKSQLAAHMGIMNIWLAKQQPDEAAKQLAELKKFWPSSPQVKWFEAQIAYQRRDFKEAGRLIEQLLVIAPENPRFLHFSASVGLQTGQVSLAENSLTKALKLAPDNVEVRRLLARTELGLGQPGKALSVIQPLVDKDSTDAEALALAGRALAQNGDNDKAREYFGRATKLNPADTSSRTALAMTKLSQGEDDSGLSDLREIAAANPSASADLPLIAALVQRNDLDGALDAIAKLEKKQPTSPLVPQLRGSVLLLKRDVVAARASFERALVLDPKFFLATLRLAALDVADKKPDLARQRFERLLALDPKNMQATLALIDLRAGAGATRDEITALLANAVKLDPTSPLARLALVEHALAGKDAQAALVAAQAGMAVAPDNPKLRDALARAQWAAGDASQAIASYNKLAIDLPRSPLPHLRLAEIHMASHNPEAAKQSLRRALVINPASTPVRRGLVALEIASGNVRAALELAQGLQKLHPRAADGYMLEGDAQMAGKNWPAAVTAYRQAYAIGKQSVAAAQLHSALLAAGKRAEADGLTAARLKEFPGDAPFIMHLAGEDLARKDYAAAEGRYTQVLRLDPKASIALNNLAWVMVQLQKKGALPYAEQANALQPDQPAFMDTLARALAFEGQTARAVAVQKKLVDTLPDNTEFRMQLARLYVQAGSKELARTELERLSDLGDKFAGQAEVDQLLKTL